MPWCQVPLSMLECCDMAERLAATGVDPPDPARLAAAATATAALLSRSTLRMLNPHSAGSGPRYRLLPVPAVLPQCSTFSCWVSELPSRNIQGQSMYCSLCHLRRVPPSTLLTAQIPLQGGQRGPLGVAGAAGRAAAAGRQPGAAVRGGAASCRRAGCRQHYRAGRAGAGREAPPGA